MTQARDLAICKNACYGTEFPSFNGQLKDFPAGILVQVFNRHNTKCCIKIREFTSNIANKYPYELYEIDYDNLTYVDKEIWPYLIAIKFVDERIKFWNDFVAAGQSMNNFGVGQTIQLHPNAEDKHHTFKCQIKYQGPVPELGLGFFLGVEFIEVRVFFDSECSGHLM